MKVSFITSGFPDGFTDEFIFELNRYLVTDIRLAFVASNFSVHERTEYYLCRFTEMFRKKGIIIEDSHIIDYTVTPQKSIELIDNADIVWLAGGPTLTQIAHIKEYGLIEALHNRNGITIGISAGSINMAKRVVLARDPNDHIPELSVYEGIGLVDFNIEPHLNEASDEHIEDIKQASKIAPIYGLFDNSFIVDMDGSIKIFGAYRLFDGGEYENESSRL